MTSYCSECGAELIDESKFCTACGKNVEKPQETTVQPEPEQPVEEKQPTPPPKTKKKPSKKLFMGLLAIIVVIVIVVLAALYLGGGNESPSIADTRFVGQWEENPHGSPFTWTFIDDGTFGITPLSINMTNGTWAVTGDQLCLYNRMVCYTYEFSDNGNKLTLNKIGQGTSYSTVIVLTKGVLQGTTETPDIQCSSDSASNRIIIESVDANVKWSDIEITANKNASWQVQDVNQHGLARIGITSTITVYVSTGDCVLVLDTTGEVILTLKFKPTNEIIGSWTVNV